MKKFLSLLLMVLFALGCSGLKVGKEPIGPKVTSNPHVTLHADVNFSPVEQLLIWKAASIWRVQTSTLAQITVIFDYDRNSLASQVRGNEQNLIGKLSQDDLDEEEEPG